MFPLRWLLVSGLVPSLLYSMLNMQHALFEQVQSEQRSASINFDSFIEEGNQLVRRCPRGYTLTPSEELRWREHACSEMRVFIGTPVILVVITRLFACSTLACSLVKMLVRAAGGALAVALVARCVWHRTTKIMHHTIHADAVRGI